MQISELRAEARGDLQGNFLKMLWPTLLTSLSIATISILLNSLTSQNGELSIMSILGMISLAFISVIFSFALRGRYMRCARGEELDNFFVEAFTLIKPAFSILWAMFVRILPITILIIILQLVGTFIVFSEIPARNIIFTLINLVNTCIMLGYMIKYYSFNFAPYLKYDYPEKSSREIIAKSQEMMRGNICKYMLILFTFIGWSFLAAAICGIISFIIMGLLSRLSNFETYFLMLGPTTAILYLISTVILSIVVTYLNMTLCEFYMDQYPAEAFDEDYEKTETDIIYFKIFLAILIAFVFIVLALMALPGIFTYNSASNFLSPF